MAPHVQQQLFVLEVILEKLLALQLQRLQRQGACDAIDQDDHPAGDKEVGGGGE